MLSDQKIEKLEAIHLERDKSPQERMATALVAIALLQQRQAIALDAIRKNLDCECISSDESLIKCIQNIEDSLHALVRLAARGRGDETK